MLFVVRSFHAKILPHTSFGSAAASNEINIPQRTFIAIKHDAVQRNLIGEVITRLENKGLKLVAIKLLQPSRELAFKHYESLKCHSFFEDLISFFVSGPIVAMVWEGIDCITLARKIVGKTHPEDAEPGTIRGDYCLGKGRNLVHASDGIVSAEKEINLWFSEDDLVTYSKTIEKWLFRE